MRTALHFLTVFFFTSCCFLLMSAGVEDDNSETSFIFFSNSCSGGTVAVTTSSTPSACNVNNGTATAIGTSSSSGGSGTITYAWSNSLSGSTITGLAPATYFVTATDLNGCTGTGSVVVDLSSNISVFASATDASCAGNDGTATASAMGGVGTYTYAWSNSFSGATITGLTPATYFVTATDSNGCTGSTSVTVGASSGCYCPSYGQSTQYEWIESIAVNGTANTTGNDNGYGDYTSVILPIETGSNSIQLTPGFAGSNYYEYWSVYIDLNQDMDFDDWGELVYYKASSNQINKSFYVPNWATPGLTRMRISMRFGGWSDQCDIFSEGEVEDYTVNITVCDNVTNGGQIEDDELLCDGATDPAEITSVAAASGGSGTLEYVWLENTTTSTPPVNSANGWNEIPNSNSPSYDPGPISQTTWYIRCARRSGCTDYMGESNVVEKTLQASCSNPSYCQSEGQSTQYEWIKKVKLGSINNFSGNNNGYADFTNLSTNLSPGQNKTIQLKPGFASGSYREYWRVWVDWNQDGDFDDTGELEVQASSFGNLWKTISVPFWAPAGTTQMRVSMKYGGYPTSCEVFSEGEVEDYSINVVTSSNLVVNPTDGVLTDTNMDAFQQTLEVGIYPNPAQEQLFVKVNQFEGSGVMRITNNLGQLIETRIIEEMSSTPLQISLDNYQKGIYYINVQTGNSESVTKKFVVVKN